MSLGYDPDEPEESSSRSSYLSKKDFKVLGIVILALGIVSIPIFQYLRKQAMQATCSSNLKAIWSATGVYAALNDDRLPPAYATAVDGGDAYVDAQLRPYTWISLMQPQMSVRASFVCPAADSVECVVNQSGNVGGVPPRSSYGMYVGVSASALLTMSQPGSTILIGETASLGANDTFDPLPMKNGEGQPIRDGFLIGYDNDPISADKQTRYATRLAYRGTAKGSFSELSEGRHPGGCHFLFCDGHLETLKAPVARIRHLGVDLLAPWSAR